MHIKRRSLVGELVICGSMSFYDEIIGIKAYLNSFNIDVLIPDNNELIYKKIINNSSNKYACAYKGFLSRIHFNKILKKSTEAILVVNCKKYSIDDYIGPNTLAEIGLAFVKNKKIFILYDFPIIYKEELCAWGAIPLRSNIKILINDMTKNNYQQLWLPGINLYGNR